jgi:hypothetical protein
VKKISKQTRRWGLIGAFVLTCFLVWWAQVYAPLQDHLEQANAELERLSSERTRLTRRLEKLEDTRLAQQKLLDDLSRYSDLIVEGGSVEEIDAHIQLTLQEFFEKHEIVLKSYNELGSTRWRDYDLPRVRFVLATTNRGVADLLEFLERMQKVIRIEQFSTHYHKTREGSLRVSLILGTLFVEPEAGMML